MVHEWLGIEALSEGSAIGAGICGCMAWIRTHFDSQYLKTLTHSIQFQ